MPSPLATKIATIAEKRRCSGEGRRRMGCGNLGKRGRKRQEGQEEVAYQGRLAGSPLVDPGRVISTMMPQVKSASAARSATISTTISAVERRRRGSLATEGGGGAMSWATRCPGSSDSLLRSYTRGAGAGCSTAHGGGLWAKPPWLLA